MDADIEQEVHWLNATPNDTVTSLLNNAAHMRRLVSNFAPDSEVRICTLRAAQILEDRAEELSK